MNAKKEYLAVEILLLDDPERRTKFKLLNLMTLICL